MRVKFHFFTVIIILFSFFCGFSQESYQIELYNLNYRINKGVKNRTSSNIHIKVHFSEGGPETLYYRDIRNRGDEEVNHSIPPIVTSRRPVKIDCYVFVNFRTGTDAKSGDPPKNPINITSGCTEGYFDQGYSPRMTNISFNYRVTPLIELEQKTNNIIGFDDPFNVSVKSNSIGFDPDLYIWQYQVGSTSDYGWTDMPAHTNSTTEPSFDVIPNVFLVSQDINKKLYFRIKPCNNGIVPNSLIDYDLRKSAPKIKGTEYINPECFGENGQVKIYFERNLDTGESISYVLYDKTVIVGYVDGEPIYQPIRNNDGDPIESFGEDSNGYFLLIEDLVPSQLYYFEMIGYGTNHNGNDDSMYEGKIMYTDGENHSTDIEVIPTPPVEFTINKEDISCNGAADGKIHLSATGGLTDQYQYIMYDDIGNVIDNWTSFSNGTTHTITIQNGGKYTIKVMDSNGCMAIDYVKDPSTGEIQELGEQIEEITIIEPEIIVVTKNGVPTNPKAFGFTDGGIYIKVTGGTPIGGNNYNISWKDKKGNSYTGSNSKMENNYFYQDLLNIGAGTYTATITDTNGCETAIEITLSEPDKLELTLEETNPISCNSTNSDDEFKLEDGQLTATASGGTAPYIYTWKKKKTDGSWEILKITSKISTPSTLDYLGQGEYAVNIKDVNNIVLGEYINNEWIKDTDSIYHIKEPNPIAITFTKEDVYCKGDNNGWIQATVTGGTLKNGEDYILQWSNGESTTRIENLYTGSYTLYVTDSNGCYQEEIITIDEPADPLQLNYTEYKQPSAAGLTDGYIEATITGGTSDNTGAYTYTWTDDQGNNLNSKVIAAVEATGYVITLNNIGKGSYYLTIIDANYNKTIINSGCTIENDKFEMDEPDPLKLSVEETLAISCNALNEYGNPYSDGELTAHVTGGVWLQPSDNGGLPYYYTWKKKDENGNWNVLANQTDSIAGNLDAGEYAVNIMDANGIILGIYKNNVLDQATDSLYTLEEPPLLELTSTQQNVYCHQGSDGWAEVNISGGTPPYLTGWSNGDTTLKTEHLNAGTYTVFVTDSRGCEAMTEVTITEPETSVMITYPAYGRPTSIGASDGFIEALVTGGTSFDDGTYTYVWTDEDGNNLNARTNTTVTASGHTIRLENITAGTYYLTAYDKNYEIATTKEGCTFTESEFIIYEPIEATIEVYVPISCNQNNEYEDPFSDGALVAHVEGGVPYSNGLPYIYHWKKQNDQGVWEELADQPDSIAYDLSNGHYALNVEDSRGSVMGVYEGDLLIKAIDSTFYFEEPELLQLSFTTTEINCDTGNDGTAEVHITGGIAPYNIRWSNGATTAKVENLIAGTYFVFVTDSRGCEVTGSVIVEQPGGLQLDIAEQIPPTCYQGSDGSITINVSGGVAPYQYQWSTGNTTNKIGNLPAGTYTLKVTDVQGCIGFTEISLETPEPIIIDLGEDRTLCNEQEVILDITIDDAGAQYLWESDNGFSSTDAVVTLTTPSTYTATVTTSEGCIGKDQIEVKASNNDIDAHFLLASQAFTGDEVILVNVSDPLSEVVEWSVPEGVETISQSHEAIILKFDKKGKYDITLRSFEGECYQDYTKSIIVEEATELVDIGDTEEPFIKEFIVYPNPSNGNFTVKVTLSEQSDASLRLISMLTAQVSSEKRLLNSSEYEDNYQLMLPSGTYILLLETPKGTKIRKVIIE